MEIILDEHFHDITMCIDIYIYIHTCCLCMYIYIYLYDVTLYISNLAVVPQPLHWLHVKLYPWCATRHGTTALQLGFEVPPENMW